MQNIRPLTLAFSAPTGFNARELLTPLRSLLTADTDIQKIVVISPAAPWRQTIFKEYGSKFDFVANPRELTGHIRLLQKLQPDIVVTPTSGLDPNDVPILEAAKSLHLPTLTYICSWDNVYKMERAHESRRPYVIADHLVVWNTVMHDHLLRIFPHLRPVQVSIVGSPRLDLFSHHDQIPSRQELMAYLGFPPDDGKLIHLATTELYPMEYIVAAMSQAVQRGTIPYPLHLYASVHPGGDIKKHEQYARKYSVTVRYSFGRQDSFPVKEWLYNPTLSDLYMLVALFKHTDVLVNQSSTVAIESFLADVPVINVMYGQRFDWWRWYRSAVYRDFKQHYQDIIDSEASAQVKTPRQLITAITNYLDNPHEQREERWALLKKMITTTDGTAGSKLLDKIKEIALSAPTRSTS